MRLRQIEVFQAIYQAGSISGAARLLNVSQPNVSRILSHTEQQLGFRLFERTAKGLHVTLAGRQLLPHVEEVYHKLRDISELTRRMSDSGARVIHVGAAHAFGQMVVAPTIVDFNRQHSGLQIELMTEHFATLCNLVLENEVDFVLAFGQHVPANLLAEPLFQSNMVAVLPLSMKAPRIVSLAWLYQQGLVMMQSNDPLGKVLHRALKNQQLSSTGAMQIKTYSVIADMVLAGGGVGVVDLFTARCYEHRLQVVPIADSLPFEVMFLSRADMPQSRSTLALKKCLKQRCREIALPLQQSA
ncbi:LysR family transcriptional regulator [Celerinatantimonas diazotrophica]|uniref:DNA-binding transcriptional LysR family regulator n=1 Tax=Celerinatantimonas diazotrophica TaxID=412034 RepID=A0A4R1J7L4_9GAMM|nr:LysR family transcriptional regulator [Celerinatantimonas diazotrophica]TCK46423.1 DNA-binding transcriptional LysR family regulator [Celerinatantimonas diazotrophica]CAG9295200.1 HTH-type transcriptional regulator YofA [Celerinatantimonas diazotrophica]